jgi:hypothetical protein
MVRYRIGRNSTVGLCDWRCLRLAGWLVPGAGIPGLTPSEGDAEHLPQGGSQVRDIIAGVVLIAIGLFFGGSVFLGDFSLFNLIFDGLGTFFIIKGLIAVYKSKQAS